MKEIIVDIDEQGNTTVTTNGFQGADCLKETAALEAALGVRKAMRPTPEMQRTAKATQTTGGKR